MTFDDDNMQFNTGYGTLRVYCKRAGVDWPPPEIIQVTGGPISEPYFRRVSYSQITDEQRSTMTHVCRGSSYVKTTPEEVQRWLETVAVQLDGTN